MQTDYITKAGGLLIKDRKLLLERHGGLDVYITPGGKVEKGENAQQALVREFAEEFGIKILETDLEKIGIFSSQAVHSPDRTVRIHTFRIKKWSGEIILADGIEDIAWVNSKNSSQYSISEIAIRLIHLLAEKDLID